MRKFEPILDMREGSWGILLAKDLPSSYPSCQKIIWRKSTSFKKGMSFFSKKIESDIPIGALKRFQTSDSDNEWGGVWVIMAGLDGKSTFLEQLGLEVNELFKRLRRAEIKTNIAEAVAETGERERMKRAEEITEEQMKIQEKIKPPMSKEFYKKYMEGEY